ncbi:MAG: hypothetical protein WBD28_07930 [Candidatus Zixiibacteriota bacterium]
MESKFRCFENRNSRSEIVSAFPNADASKSQAFDVVGAGFAAALSFGISYQYLIIREKRDLAGLIGRTACSLGF